MTTTFIKLAQPTSNIVEVLNRWENDPALIPLTRPNKTQSELDRRDIVSLEDLTKRMEDHYIYLIYLDDELIGEMNYVVDPPFLFKKSLELPGLASRLVKPSGEAKGLVMRPFNIWRNR